MKFVVMSVFDSKARAFLTPFFVSHVDVGIRCFAQAAGRADTQVGSAPEDFTLWQLGHWDDDNGMFTLVTPYVNLGTAAYFKAARETQLKREEVRQHVR